MTTQLIKTPDLGVEQAQVIEIMVAVGDIVSAEDTIALVESDKASVEIPAGQAGQVTELLVKVGDDIRQGTGLLKLSAEATKNPETHDSDTEKTQVETAETESSEVSSNTSSDNSSTSTQTFSLPDLGVDKAEVIEVLAKVGDVVSEQDNIVLLESEKASMEVPSPASGEIVGIHVQQGDNVSAGVEFITLKTNVTNTSNTKIEQQSSQQIAPVSEQAPHKAVNVDNSVNNTQASDANSNLSQNKNVYAGPAVRKLCRELGVDITQVTGSAVNGRIIKEDVHAYVKNQLDNPSKSGTHTGTMPASTGLPPLPDMSGAEWGETHEEPLTNLQKVSIPQLVYNTQIPQVTQFDLADITDTENYRKTVKDALKKDGISLTIVAFVIKAVAYALKQYPKFNSHLNDDHTKLIMRDEVHVGMAVSTDHGLIVPVLRHADQKGLVQIATELKELAGKARAKKLGMSALTGAGFSISSQGNMGGTYFTPLVNVPQVAILGVSEATIQPRWNASTETFEPRLMLPLSLSYDHRVINGADAAIFTRYLANLLADVRQVLM